MSRKRYFVVSHAISGLRMAWKGEPHFVYQVTAACIALLASWAFRITVTEFLFVLLMIGLVLSAELFNTAIEEVCDKYTPEHDPHIGKIKDLSAAAVLIVSSASFVIGCVIFIPYISHLS